MNKLILTTIIAIVAFSASAQHEKKPAVSNQKSLVWKPTKRETSQWDEGTFTYNLQDSTYWVYDPMQSSPESTKRVVNGQLTSETLQDWNANGDVILEQNNVDMGMGIDTVYRYVYTYDNYHNMLTYKRYTNNAGNLVLNDNSNRSYVHTLNANNQPTLTITKRYNTAMQQNEDYFREVFSYNSAGKMEYYSIEKWENNVWEKLNRFDITFDINGNVIGATNYQPDPQNNWIAYGRESNILAINPGANYLDMEFLGYIFEEYNTTSLQFELNQRMTTTVNGNETLVTYDAYENNNWLLDETQYDETDAFGNLLRTIKTNRNGNDFDTISYQIHNYILDGNNRPATDFFTDSLLNQKYKFVYSDYVQVDQQTAAITEVSASTFTIYPNPATSVVNIQDIDVVIAQLFDFNGKLLLQSTSNTIDISSLKSGFYMLKIEDSNGSSAIQRLVKQ